jgi:hypothetical protein
MGSLRTLKRRGQRHARRARALRRADPNYKPLTLDDVMRIGLPLLKQAEADFFKPDPLYAYLRKSR